MTKLLLWLIVLFLCWPLAIIAILFYPLIWVLLIPFKLIGITLDAVFELLKAIITLPSRIIGNNTA